MVIMLIKCCVLNSLPPPTPPPHSETTSIIPAVVAKMSTGISASHCINFPVSLSLLVQDNGNLATAS